MYFWLEYQSTYLYPGFFQYYMLILECIKHHIPRIFLGKKKTEEQRLIGNKEITHKLVHTYLSTCIYILANLSILASGALGHGLQRCNSSLLLVR